MTDLFPRRFTFAAPPGATEWLGEALRKVFACPKSLPASFGKLIERLNRIY